MEEAAVAALLMSEFMLTNTFDEETDDEDEEELLAVIIILKKYKRKPPRIQNYLENTVANFSSKQFQQNFRISVDAYERLLSLIGPTLQRKNGFGRHTINIEKQLLAVIWLLATPDSYRSVGERFDLGKSSLSISFVRVVTALCNLAPAVITWPSGDHLLEIKEQFRRMAGLQNVIGAVDGTYIDIKAPRVDPEAYITRKCRYSMTLQAICDPRLKFTDIFMGFPGSVNDNRIFRNSDIYRFIQNDVQHYCPEDEFIIGDKAYPCCTWCIPPYINRGNLTAAKRYFNTVLAKTRQTIERAFALLFGRLRRLKYLDMQRTDWIPSTVLAASVLHNICLDYTSLDEMDNFIREGLDNLHHNNEVNNYEDDGVVEGRNKRDAICRELYAARHHRN